MAFREIVAPTVKELFIQQLEGMILSGELRPGDRLPTERELADEMKISKTVVHEGLRELHRLGFLDIASRRGVTVADYAQTGSLETLRAIMDFHGGLPDAKTAGSILQLRYYLEGPAMEELAARHTPGDMAALPRQRSMPVSWIYSFQNSRFTRVKALNSSGVMVLPLRKVMPRW